MRAYISACVCVPGLGLRTRLYWLNTHKCSTNTRMHANIHTRIDHLAHSTESAENCVLLVGWVRRAGASAARVSPSISQVCVCWTHCVQQWTYVFACIFFLKPSLGWKPKAVMLNCACSFSKPSWRSQTHRHTFKSPFPVCLYFAGGSRLVLSTGGRAGEKETPQSASTATPP